MAVGTVIGYLAGTAEDLEQVRAAVGGAPAASPTEQAEPATLGAGLPPMASTTSPPPPRPPGPCNPARVLASPRARARARDLGIDLSVTAQ